MTTLNKYSREQTFEYVNDFRYDTAQKRIPLDKDNRDCMIDMFYSINNVPTIINDPTNNTEVKFDVSLGGSDSVLDLDKSGIILGFNFYKHVTATPLVNLPLAATESCPWNTLAFFRSINIKASDSSEAIQMYDDANLIADASEHAILMEYGYDTLNNMHDVFFTPTLETALDTVTALSAESVLRSAAWCRGDINVQIHKFVPLALIFNSLDKQVFLKNLKKLIISMYFHPNNYYQMSSTTHATETIRTNITKCQLMLVQSKCTGRQELQNVNSTMKGQTENLAFLNRVAIKQTFTNVPIQLSAMSNLNMVSFGFKAVDYFSATYVNPCQYIPRFISAGPNEGHGITNLSATYGSITVPQNGFTLSTINNSELVAIYQTYRQCCFKSGTSKDVSPGIPFDKYGKAYCIFYIPFYDTIFMKESAENKRVQLNITADTATYARMANVRCTTVLHSIGSCQLFTDGSVSVLKSTY